VTFCGYYLLNLFLNFPSLSFSHSRHSAIAFSLSSGELAGLKLSQVEAASRRHISAKKRVCKFSLANKSINSGIEFRDISRRFLINSLRFIKKFQTGYAEYKSFF
jgi:hypothetical protein